MTKVDIPALKRTNRLLITNKRKNQRMEKVLNMVVSRGQFLKRIPMAEISAIVHIPASTAFVGRSWPKL